MPDRTLHVAIIGMGPRGLSVLERLVARLTAARPPQPVRIHTIDPGEAGAGRIWRTDQPDTLLMNTAAGEVSLYSGEPDDGPWRAGAGPSLYQWLQAAPQPEVDALTPNTYAPRRVYGRYLHDVFDRITCALPPDVTVSPVTARARNLRRDGDGRYTITTSEGRRITADKVVLTTGHPHHIAGRADRDLLDFASRHRGTRYLRGASAADMELDELTAGSPVGILGLGLTFYDVAAELTVGRGGHFVQRSDGSLEYAPSGHEPHIVAGSRSGLPMLARGRNQKDAYYRYQPVFFTSEALADLRRANRSATGDGQLRFRSQVLPLMLREVEHVYYTTHVRRRDGELAAQVFANWHRAAAGDAESTATLLKEAGLADLPAIDLETMARPFTGQTFTSPGAFHERLTSLLREDARQAEQGNLDNPLKAALDIMRDIRGVVRDAVEFSSLHPDSHRDEFLGWFNPINTMVSAGPPAVRVSQAIALIEAGVLTVVGPSLRIGTNEDTGRFTLQSPQVAGSYQETEILIDARIPRADARIDASPLMRQLIDDGLASMHVNINARDGARFATGALAVTEKPYRLVDATGRPSRGLYALGIPTEDLRWFTQIGNGRPGPMVGFHTDADAIAADVLGHKPPIGAHPVRHSLPTTALSRPIAADL
ncbi:FAD/NAD(P)-binding protein [Streptomyces sp. NPDC002144]